MKILVVEDEEIAASTLKEALITHHYGVDIASDGQLGLELAQTYSYDLILLDIILPKLDGISLCRQLRSQGNSTPILLLSGKNSTHERVSGLEAGADDYLTKPYDFQELLARIRALLRRGTHLESNLLSWENLQVYVETGLVFYNDKQIHLTLKEYCILELFLHNPYRTFSRNAIIDRIWSLGEFPGEEAVTTHIKGLRQKLKAAGMKENLIETVYGMGYRLRRISQIQPIQTHAGKKLNRTSEGLQIKMEQMWEEFRAPLLQKVALFQEVSHALKLKKLTPELRHQAVTEAHRLIGSLGIFNFMEAAEEARKVEMLLQSAEVKGVRASKKVQDWTNLLERIAAKPVTAKEKKTATQLLIIDDDVVLTQQIEKEAIARGFEVQTAQNLQAAREAISNTPPDVIILDLTFPDTTESGLNFLAERATSPERIPVLVLTNQNQMSSRLAVARLGGYLFLQKPIAVPEILNTVQQTLSASEQKEAHLLIVDDDSYLLNILYPILRNWGFQVTALADAQQFWQVLETTQPDLIILDVEMPNYSGLELCQIVRNDARWHDLPVLFLSAHSDSETIQRVFSVGGDDYIRKPIIEPELIARILNRLERRKIQHKVIQKTHQETGYSLNSSCCCGRHGASKHLSSARFENT